VSGIPREPVAALVDSLLPEQYHGKTRQEVHITLWHALQAGGGAPQRDALLAAVGKEVAFEVVALDYSPEVGRMGRHMVMGPAALQQLLYSCCEPTVLVLAMTRCAAPEMRLH
jgi:hypothetical protein